MTTREEALEAWTRCTSGHTTKKDMDLIRAYIEQSAVDDIESIWQKTVNNTLTKNTGSKKGIERLFIPKNQHANT